jgi:outer membrane usher protein FimD/PapC
MSSLIHDRRDTLQRTIAGDFFASSGDIGTTVNLGGLSFAKLYNLDPYFIRYPQQNIVGQVAVPSEVDVFIDGQKINTFRMQPGPFELRNITESIGSRNVDLVIRDVFGREQRIVYNYYSTDVPLRAGLHEYSYNLGALRKNFGVDSNLYGPLAFSAFHRYGVTDALTLGARGEGRSGQFNAGPTVSLVLGPAGVLNVSAAASEDAGKRGGAGLASYTYLGREVSIGLLMRKDSRYYASLLDSVQDRRNYEFGGSLGYFHRWAGSFSVGYSQFRAYEGQDRTSRSVGYSRSILDSRANVFVTFRNMRAQENVNQIFAGFIYNFDAQHSGSINYQRLGAVHAENIQLQKAQPVGEGLGYNIAFDRVTSSEGVANQLAPSVQYNSRWGILRADYAQQSGPTGLNRSHRISAAGGIAYVGDVVALVRPVTDGFGLVRVADVEGVRVSVNNQEVGQTDAHGNVFVPDLASFNENQVSIKAANVPLEYSIGEVLKRVSPPYRGGAVIDFAARRINAIIGTLKIRRNGELRPAEFYEVIVMVDGAAVTFRTGRGGEYYVEGLKAGRYAARIGKDGEPCTFDIVVPKTQEPFVELPELICEHHRAAVLDTPGSVRAASDAARMTPLAREHR